MTEPRRDWPAGLPIGPDAPAFTPPDPTALLQRGRTIRRVHALVATTTVVALMAVGSAVAVEATTHRADRLRVVTPAVHRTPTPHATSGKQSPAAPDSTTVLAGGTQESRPSNTVASPAGRPPLDVAPAQVIGTASSVPTASPFRRTTVTNPPPTSCAYQPTSAPSGWCLDNSSPDTAQSGVPVELSVDVCRIKGLGTGTLRFGNAEEADVAIWGPADAQSWEWTHGRTFAKTPHTLTVRAGECLRWTTRWTTRANDGSLLPRGSYSIQVSVASPDTDLPNTVTGTATDFTLT